MKCSLGISNFLEEISSLSHSIVFSISLHWSLRKALLSLLAILRNSAFKWEYLSFSPLPFTSLLFIAICKASSDNHFAFLHFMSGSKTQIFSDTNQWLTGLASWETPISLLERPCKESLTPYWRFLFNLTWAYLCPYPSSRVTGNWKGSVGLGEGAKKEGVKPAGHVRLEAS